MNQVANVDEVLLRKKRINEDYKEKLKLPDYEIQNMSYEEIMKVLSKATVRTKRIIYFSIGLLWLMELWAREVEFLEK